MDSVRWQDVDEVSYPLKARKKSELVQRTIGSDNVYRTFGAGRFFLEPT